MEVLLLALALLAVSGFLALLTGSRPRLATLLGTSGAVAGCVLGLVPAWQALFLEETGFQRHWAWDVPYGSFALDLDPLSAFFLLPILGLSALAAIYGSQYLLAVREHKNLGVAWFFYNGLIASMVLVVVARNGLLFLTAWEIMSLTSYFLVVFEDEKESVREAGRVYLIASHLGTAFLLVLFIVLGREANSLDFDRIAGTVPAEVASLLFLLALVGFGTKAGFMPLHVWLPEAHPAAPSHVSAVMSGVMVKTGIYGLMRTWTLLPQPGPLWWGWVLIGIGIVSGVWGILLGLAQHDLKRMLAYSTVENVGIIALGLGVGLLGVSAHSAALTILGLGGALLHVLNHATFKGLLFLGAGVVLHETGTREMDRLGGLLKRMPAVATAFLVGAVAICGLPPLNGFMGEFLIYLGVFRAEPSLGASSAAAAIGVIVALALIGGLAAVAFSKVFGIVFLGQPRSAEAAHAHAPGLLMSVPMFVLATGCLLLALAAPSLLSYLAPVIEPIAAQPADAIQAQLFAAMRPLYTVTLAAVVLILVALLLAELRRRLLADRPVSEANTWGCGYTRPTVRMQYTGSSLVQPLLVFFEPFLRPRRQYTAPTGLFPQEAAIHTQTPDLPRERLYRPVFDGIAWVFSRLRWLQHGNVHLYVLYIGLTLVVLLLWYVGVKAG
jgi:formate hydrogenlyase subunit 3/multisubunit Na+/H+ antiporter MnhD subunit